ncbi:type II toxin-antitoxin system VapC family toxin [Brevundimonas sp. LM2]|uniref:type II toxin-antitoxin system VapC family toxin n=1 Tax=Brevundimonas sp. LM2 TaxID=1938605 RepID=UPI0015C56DA5|nr:PIN domain-containing protein [Brevundimonas sp. LM2]
MLIWLSQRRARVLGTHAFQLASRHDWIVSPAVLLELEILHGIKRLKVAPDQVFEAAREIGDLTLSTAAFDKVVRDARGLAWTRDPIDRLITAHAILDGAKLLTADQTILAHFKDAVWD